MDFISNSKLSKLFLFGLTLLLLNSNDAFAEGTPSLSPPATFPNPQTITGVTILPDVQSGSYWDNITPAGEDNRIYFYINNPANENLYFGFDWRNFVAVNAIRINNLYYRIYNPSGTQVQFGLWNSANNIAGSIDTYNEAIIGPNIGGVTTGYDPLVFDPTVAGEFWIEFYRSDDGGVTPITTNLGRAVAPFFDLTVANSSGVNPRKSGRIHSDKWGLVALTPSTTANNSIPTNGFGVIQTSSSSPQLYVYTDDKVILKVNFGTGFKPLAYDLALNSYGVSNIGPWATTRRSINSTTAPSLLNGFKIFLNQPDPIQYGIATVPAAPVFLNPAITNCSPFNINFNTSEPGDVSILIDANGTPGYQPNTSDLIIEENNLPAGNNSISWNGLDALGNNVPDGTLMELTLNYLKGRYNLPLYDAEINKSGINVAVIQPIQIANSLMYWDDSLLTNVGTNCIPNTNNQTGTGINNSIIGTPGPAHAWSFNGNPTQLIPAPDNGSSPNNENDNTTCNDFGNGRIINTWGWGIKSEKVTEFIYKGCSDLRVVKTGPASAISGNPVSFTITASNLGSSNDTDVTVTDLLPTGYTFSSYLATNGTYDNTSGIWTIGNLNNGSSAVLTINVVVNTTGNYTNTACIEGTNTDPFVPNNCSSITPTVTVPPTVTIGDFTVTEGGALVFPISLSNSVTTPITLTFAITNQTTSNADWTPPGTLTITIPANTITSTFTINTVDDIIIEGTETLLLSIASSTGPVGNSTDTGIGTINDNEDTLVITVADASATEGNTITFPVTLSNPVAVPT
ncbi:hypothetical protein, partial [Flavobacterium sp.]|uniref:hypothetical protein n=1 Tax=Flavobacterium sp. TaxID=239 RepID=UPI0037BF54F6